MARLRSPWSRYQVPCPMTATLAPVLPKGFVFIFAPDTARSFSQPPSSSRVQYADVGDQYATGGRLRDIEPIFVRATDRDIGAIRPRARLDPRNQFAVGREHEDMAERGVTDEQAALGIHGQAIGATGTEQRAEAADLRHAAILHERQPPHRVVARHRDEQHGLGWVEHQT